MRHDTYGVHSVVDSGLDNVADSRMDSILGSEVDCLMTGFCRGFWIG